MCYPGVLLDLLWRPRAVEESSLVRWEVRVLEQGVLSQSLYIYSDIALFAIFENWHIAADKGYFYMINTEKSSSLIMPKNHRDPKYYLWNVLFIIFWGPCAKLRSNISKLGKGRCCWLEDGIDSIPCRALYSHLAPGWFEEKRNKRTATWRNGCFFKNR